MLSFQKIIRKISIRKTVCKFRLVSVLLHPIGQIDDDISASQLNPIRIFTNQNTHPMDRQDEINDTVINQHLQSSHISKDVCGELAINPTEESKDVAQLKTAKATANPPDSSSNHTTSFDCYYPGLNDRTRSFLKGLSSQDTAIMASTTIETNQLHQGYYKAFRAHETELIRNLFVSENQILLFCGVVDFLQRIEEVMSKNEAYQEI
ncbi:hypothetical protein MJO28_016476 [Puccinia striiformis f. sp. tritici]|uniref:Uncharacterized protein n=2 Tax=Puccinia striiformis TaxID=27350 RepID=A0A2S4VRP8_9BASI|nr:hypothetical protein MJO28_016476 [Puccinia striiformis f. sp. tritici]POW12138.1 hypothetical protein PSTT_04768 [Puccinia striiformis]